jgi:hypothetical protein
MGFTNIDSLGAPPTPDPPPDDAGRRAQARFTAASTGFRTDSESVRRIIADLAAAHTKVLTLTTALSTAQASRDKHHADMAAASQQMHDELQRQQLLLQGKFNAEVTAAAAAAAAAADASLPLSDPALAASQRTSPSSTPSSLPHVPPDPALQALIRAACQSVWDSLAVPHSADSVTDLDQDMLLSERLEIVKRETDTFFSAQASAKRLRSSPSSTPTDVRAATPAAPDSLLLAAGKADQELADARRDAEAQLAAVAGLPLPLGAGGEHRSVASVTP